MFDSELFVREFVRREDQGQLDKALSEMWTVNYNILQFTLEEDNAFIPIPSNVIEVKYVFLNQLPLSKNREILLDIEDSNWRNAASDLPTSFLWHGESNQLQLYPPPDDTYELWVFIQETPLHNFPKWFHLIKTLRATELLTVSDQVVGRPDLVQVMQKWRGAFAN